MRSVERKVWGKRGVSGPLATRRAPSKPGITGPSLPRQQLAAAPTFDPALQAIRQLPPALLCAASACNEARGKGGKGLNAQVGRFSIPSITKPSSRVKLEASELSGSILNSILPRLRGVVSTVSMGVPNPVRFRVSGSWCRWK
jgi:hypothetical protein